jgi:hypothetical protein
VVQVLFSCAGGVLLPEAGGVAALAVAGGVVVLAPPGPLLVAAAGGVVVLAVAVGGIAGAGVTATVPVVPPETGADTQTPPCATDPGGQV